MKRTKALLAALLCALTLTGCGNGTSGGSSAQNASATSAAASGVDALWENAVYKEDASVGEGAHNIKIEVKIGSKSLRALHQKGERSFGGLRRRRRVLGRLQGRNSHTHGRFLDNRCGRRALRARLHFCGRGTARGVNTGACSHYRSTPVFRVM